MSSFFKCELVATANGRFPRTSPPYYQCAQDAARAQILVQQQHAPAFLDQLQRKYHRRYTIEKVKATAVSEAVAMQGLGVPTLFSLA